MSDYHIPVMPKEVTYYLAIKNGSWYIDCTLGGGGHTGEILKIGGKVLGIDLDPDAINEVAKKFGLRVEEREEILQAISNNLILVNNNLKYVRQIVSQFNLRVQGVLFDLGVSSHQLETPQRGFSFNLDAPLDMRMDPINQKVKAADLVNGLHERELAELFLKLGGERFAKRIAKKIVDERQKKKVETTNELAQIILSVRPRLARDRTHPATRVFQALRIAVNDELNNLREALPQALEVLQPGGCMIVISFHSLEDRIVKNYFRDWEKDGLVKILTKKPVSPMVEEIEANPRARSGKLRVVEKVPNKT